MDVGKQSQFSINGTWVKEVYRVKGAIAHRGRSLLSMIALFIGAVGVCRPCQGFCLS